MFAANIWLTSAFTVTVIFSASAMYKSYSDIQEAKQIQEHFQVITDIKTLLAKQYNKNPQDVTRDEIIAYLPSNSNWDKVLLLDRNSDSTLSEDELVNSDGKMVLNENERLKLLAIRAKLRDTLNTTTVAVSNGNYTFDIAYNKSIKEKDKTIESSLDKAIYFLIQKTILDTSTTVNNTLITQVIDSYTPLNDIYQKLNGITETSTTVEIEAKKKEYFQSLLKERLKMNKNTQEARLYTILKDLL